MAEAGGGTDGSGLLAAVALAFLVGIFGVLAFLASKMGSPAAEEEQPRQGPREKKEKKRGALDRMQKGAGARAAAAGDGTVVAAAAAAADGEEEGEEDEEESGDDADGGRAGRRGVVKDQKKQEKKEQQAAAREMRHQRDSVKTDKNQKYSQKQQDRETERLRQEEEDLKAREEKEKKEGEDFDKWKEMFAVEASGEDDPAKADESVVERFIEFVKVRKVVNLEDLSAEFKMRTSAAIDRIEQLEKMDRISGIFDDRGRYLFITKEEMQGVADWLQRKGRITRADLVAACNRIIRLNPTEEDKARLQREAETAASALEEGGEEEEKTE